MDNYTRFPNAILEAIISGRYTEMQMTAILYIVRKTYGWHKSCDSISIKKMAEETGYARRAMLRTITQLEELNIISVERPGIGKTGTMSINSPDSWRKPVTTRSHTKEIKISNKTTKESFSPAGNDMRAIENENDMSSANASTESDLILPDEVFEDDSLWT